MAEDPNALAVQIQGQRAKLGHHVQELEERLRETTDWRNYVRRRPFAMLASAFGLGLGIALFFSKHTGIRRA